jgi:hypothetical protein
MSLDPGQSFHVNKIANQGKAKTLLFETPIEVFPLGIVEVVIHVRSGRPWSLRTLISTPFFAGTSVSSNLVLLFAHLPFGLE